MNQKPFVYLPNDKRWINTNNILTVHLDAVNPDGQVERLQVSMVGGTRVYVRGGDVEYLQAALEGYIGGKDRTNA